MPKLEPKVVQKELEQGQLWPVYWIYGLEKMKSRELLKRIRKTVLGDQGSSLLSLSEETFDGAETSVGTILDAAQSLSLGGGLRFIVVRDAHSLKEADQLAPLLGAPTRKREDLNSVCVFLSKDLDARRKFSKLLVEKAAVVPCEEVMEADREAWVAYLAKRKGLAVTAEVQLRLAALDPWNLDIVDQELEKLSLAGTEDTLLLGTSGPTGEQFLDGFFRRKRLEALSATESFATRPDEALPLLGLLGWNVRHLAILVADREMGGRAGAAKLNQFAIQRLQPWVSHWKLAEISDLGEALAEIDYAMKQTPALPLGLWHSLVDRFCN